MTHRVRYREASKKCIQEERGHQEGFDLGLRGEGLDYFPRRHLVFPPVGSSDVPVRLILKRLCEEVVQSCKDLPVIKLGLDAGMSAFDVGVGVGTPQEG